jgi:hypothetical protein
MYKEAQAAPPPTPIGGIIADCGSCTHDIPSASPFSPPPLFMGWWNLSFYEDLVFWSLMTSFSKVDTFKSQRFQKSTLSKVNAFKSQCF